MALNSKPWGLEFASVGLGLRASDFGFWLSFDGISGVGSWWLLYKHRTYLGPRVYKQYLRWAV